MYNPKGNVKLCIVIDVLLRKPQFHQEKSLWKKKNRSAQNKPSTSLQWTATGNIASEINKAGESPIFVASLYMPLRSKDGWLVVDPGFLRCPSKRYETDPYPGTLANYPTIGGYSFSRYTDRYSDMMYPDTPANRASPWKSRFIDPIYLTREKNPSSKVYVTETVWSPSLSAYILPGSQTDVDGSFSGRDRATGRHNGFQPLGFLDGHVTCFPAREIWKTLPGTTLKHQEWFSFKDQ